MKIDRRGFFAALLAPFLPKPKLPWWLLGRALPRGWTPKYTPRVSLNGWPESLDADTICPDWDGNIYPTYGGLSRSLSSSFEMSCAELKSRLLRNGMPREWLKDLCDKD